MNAVCLIYNPAAHGEKANALRRKIERLSDVTLMPTERPEHATELAAKAADNGAELVIAVGGDGTLYEVINGLMRASRRPRLGLIPAGTANVFALEHGIPWDFEAALQTALHGVPKTIDLIRADSPKGTHYAAQLAGVGFDAMTLGFVSWELKKKFGKLAYWVASVKALLHPRRSLCCEFDGQRHECELALIGNGRFYGGRLVCFPDASAQDGKMDLTLYPKVGLITAARVGIRILTGRSLCLSRANYFQTNQITITSPGVDFELEGEWVGVSPVTFSIIKHALCFNAPDPR